MQKGSLDFWNVHQNEIFFIISLFTEWVFYFYALAEKTLFWKLYF